MLRRTRTVLAAAALAALVAGCGAAVVPQIMNDSSRLPLARKMYDKGDYAVAVEVLTRYEKSGAGNADIDQAVYLLGLAYLKQRDWANAQAQFERVLRDYPESDSASASSYRLGEAFFGQARGRDFDQEFTLKALTQWDSFVKGSPDHPFAGEAQLKIGACRARLASKLWRTAYVYYKMAFYQPAKLYFRSIVLDYPDTPDYGNALIGMALTDGRLGNKDSALTRLRGLEEDFAGRPLGMAAKAWRHRVERWPAEGDSRRRGHRIIEAPAVPQLPTTPSTTGAPGQS